MVHNNKKLIFILTIIAFLVSLIFMISFYNGEKYHKNIKAKEIKSSLIVTSWSAWWW
jgi:CHASE3 domain sensor protein